MSFKVLIYVNFLRFLVWFLFYLCWSLSLSYHSFICSSHSVLVIFLLMLWFHTVFFTFWEHLTLPFFSLILVLEKDSSQHLSYGSQLYLSSGSLSVLIFLSYQVILIPATLFLWLFTSVLYTSVSQRTCLITLCWRFKTIALYLVSEQFGFVFFFCFFFPLVSKLDNSELVLEVCFSDAQLLYFLFSFSGYILWVPIYFIIFSLLNLWPKWDISRLEVMRDLSVRSP